MKVKILRTINLNGEKLWVCFTKNQTLKSQPNESKNKLIERWKALHGNIEKITRFSGIMRPYEAAATIVTERISNQ